KNDAKIAEQKRKAEEAKLRQKAEQERLARQIQEEQNSTPQNEISSKKYQWKQLVRTEPKYPRKALQTKTTGWVDIELTIDSSGKVVNAKVIKTSINGRVFHNEALRAVRKWVFEAPTDYGIKENLTKKVRLEFKL
ncbi:MAG TPA: TonB family protein, partial [Oceanospirillales bacterium]|nr:TonB family protein [Oceanospirillales bacterium]